MCNTDYKQAIGCCSTPQFSVSRWRDIQSLPSPQQPPFDVDVGRQQSSSSEGGEMETCTEHESIPPAHLLPGMCPTSRWHSAKPSETTPFAPVAPSALLRCCGNTIRLLNSGPAAHRPALLNARDSLSRSSGHGRGTLEARARLDSSVLHGVKHTVIHCLKNR